MLAHHGYQDGSGDFFIVVDTDRCTGCGDCVAACPAGALVMVEDEFDIESEDEVMAVAAKHRSRIKYSCGPCKPASGYARSDLPCVRACEPNAIDHSW